ncbi:hypothetical protein [Streptomyces ochraceiscleroticus]|uniref:Tat pathway signal sequence domain protein n=1 Tax=Streptomyces ochraceiscleroticus TaxID=47761 RepID=A0ABW1MQN6_9ACTN|nr:hypothetical protein [Streptomyces ochraceiscleroticus]
MSTEANYVGRRRLPPIPPPPPYRPAAAASDAAREESAPDTRTTAVPPRPAVPPKPSRPAPPGYRDTASFHLAQGAAKWHGAKGGKAPAKKAAPAAPPAGPSPAETSPQQQRAASRTPLPPQKGPLGNPAPGVAAPPVPGQAAAPTTVPGQPAPAPSRRHALRTAAAAACLVLGLGLIGGAAAGSWLAGGPSGDQAAAAAFTDARALWHSVPVRTLFPQTLHGTAAGPGGADRTWHRIAVAPDGGCAKAFDPLLAKALAPAGCKRLLRADYVDATHSSVITVGVVTTRTDLTGMRALNKRFTTERLAARRDLMPRPYTAPGTPAADFGPDQRASWSVQVLSDAPFVVYAVSGFADGRAVPDPRPADEATRTGATSAPAQAGLGHDAAGVADGIERAFRTQLAKATEADG